MNDEQINTLATSLVSQLNAVEQQQTNLYTIFIFGVLMIVAGFIGGSINYINDRRNARILPETSINYHTWGEHIVIAFGATLLVPLFLSMISSDLPNLAGKDYSKFLIFLGFCLVAAYSAKNFISTISKQVMDKANKATHDVEDMQEMLIQMKKRDNKIEAATNLSMSRLNREDGDYAAALEFAIDSKDTLESGEAWANIAICERFLEHFPEALEAGQKSVELGHKIPSNIAKYHWNLACYQSLSELPIEEIIENIKKAYDIYPKIVEGYDTDPDPDLEFARKDTTFNLEIDKLLVELNAKNS